MIISKDIIRKSRPIFLLKVLVFFENCRCGLTSDDKFGEGVLGQKFFNRSLPPRLWTVGNAKFLSFLA